MNKRSISCPRHLPSVGEIVPDPPGINSLCERQMFQSDSRVNKDQRKGAGQRTPAMLQRETVRNAIVARENTPRSRIEQLRDTEKTYKTRLKGRKGITYNCDSPYESLPLCL